MVKRGPKTRYDAKRHPVVCQALGAAGHTDKEIARLIGVCEKTFHVWKKRYPELLQPLKDEKVIIDDEVELTLLQRALGGYQMQETTIREEVGGQHGDKLTTTTKTSTLAPDVTAQIFWLKNRRPNKWRQYGDWDPGDGANKQSEGVKIIRTLPGPPPPKQITEKKDNKKEA